MSIFVKKVENAGTDKQFERTFMLEATAQIVAGMASSADKEIDVGGAHRYAKQIWDTVNAQMDKK